MNDADLLSQLRIDPNQREGGAPRRHWGWVISGVIVILAGVAAGLFVLRGGAAEVDTAVARSAAAGGNTAVLEATGYVTARREATVSSKITGKLADVLIEEGDHVQEGQVLARLDDTDEKARMELAQAQMAAAKAQLGALETRFRQAQRDLKRQQELSTRGLTATQALEDARTQVESLSAQLQAQRMQIGVAEAQWHITQVNYNNTVIRAPFSGVVIAKAAQPGEIVSPMSAGGGFTRTGICTIVDMDSLEIEVDVNEAYINRVKPHQPVAAVLDAYPDWKIPAEVIAIIPTADRSKATVRVRIALKQKDPRIVPDMGVRVSFLQEQPQNPSATRRGVLIPATAIVQRNGDSIVFVVDGDRARRRDVTPGQSYGELRLIDSGLQNGERVVRDPPAELVDGMRVKIRSSNA